METTWGHLSPKAGCTGTGQSPETDPDKDDQLIFSKGAMGIQWGTDASFQQRGRNSGIAICKKNNQPLPHTTKTNLLQMDHRPKYKSETYNTSKTETVLVTSD